MVFCKFLEPNTCFTMKMGFSVSITKIETPLYLPAGGLESKSRPQKFATLTEAFCGCYQTLQTNSITES